MLSRLMLRQLQARTSLALAPDAVGRAIRQRAKEIGEPDEAKYIARALRDEDELQTLVDLVVVPESWFMRDADAFAPLVGLVRAKLGQRSGPVRILSVPCASGEEPYSIAIALLDAGIRPRDFAIVGVDVSRRALDNARRGVYPRNAFRAREGQYPAFRDRYFSASGKSFELRRDVRELVRFHQQNLLALAIPSGEDRFDAVFCRNLLIYFDDATQQAAAGKLRALLADDGLLFVGYAEAASLCRYGFARAPFPKAFALIKKNMQEQRAAAEVTVPPVSPPLPARLWNLSATERPAAVPLPAKRAPLPADELAQARVLADQGKLEDAAARYHAYLRTHPESAEAHFMLGLLSERQHDARAAEQHLRRALYLDPDHYEAICHLALLAEQHGDAPRAAAYKRRAARIFGRLGGERANK